MNVKNLLNILLVSMLVVAVWYWNSVHRKAEDVLYSFHFALGGNSTTYWSREILQSPTASAYHRRGLSYYAKDEYDHALADFVTAIEMQGGNPVFLASRGDCHFAMNRYAEAAADYEKALSIEPRDPQTLYQVCRARYNSSGRHVHPEALSEIPSWLSGHLRQEVGKEPPPAELLREIVDRCSRSLELAPGQSEALNLRGICLRLLGAEREAIEDHTKAIALDPKRPEPYYYRGLAYFRGGDDAGLTRAIADFDAALAIDSGHRDWYFQRCLAHIILAISHGDNARLGRAQEDFNSASSGAPHYRDAHFSSLVHWCRESKTP